MHAQPISEPLLQIVLLVIASFLISSIKRVERNPHHRLCARSEPRLDDIKRPSEGKHIPHIRQRLAKFTLWNLFEDWLAQTPCPAFSTESNEAAGKVLSRLVHEHVVKSRQQRGADADAAGGKTEIGNREKF